MTLPSRVIQYYLSFTKKYMNTVRLSKRHGAKWEEMLSKDKPLNLPKGWCCNSSYYINYNVETNIG